MLVIDLALFSLGTENFFDPLDNFKIHLLSEYAFFFSCASVLTAILHVNLLVTLWLNECSEKPVCYICRSNDLEYGAKLCSCAYCLFLPFATKFHSKSHWCIFFFWPNVAEMAPPIDTPQKVYQNDHPSHPPLNERILSSMTRRSVAAHPWHDLEIGMLYH